MTEQSWVDHVLSQPENKRIYEKISLGIDIDKLRSETREILKNVPPVMQGTHFGGWSVLSASGFYKDGWQMGHKCFKIVNGREVPDRKKLVEIGYKPSTAHINFTEIASPEIQNVVEKMRELKLRPTRARMTILTSGGKSAVHRDAADHVYCVRLHVPIFTNPECKFVCQEGWAHLPADGSGYFLKVNRLHQIYNQSDEDRVHLISDVIDSTGVSQRHRKMTKLQPKNV